MTRREPPVDLVDLILRLHETLAGDQIAHAFGGALALAWCTEEPRATNDIDLNIFAPVAAFERVLETLPPDMEVSEQARAQLARDGQARLWCPRPGVNLGLGHPTAQQPPRHNPTDTPPERPCPTRCPAPHAARTPSAPHASSAQQSNGETSPPSLVYP